MRTVNDPAVPAVNAVALLLVIAGARFTVTVAVAVPLSSVASTWPGPLVFWELYAADAEPDRLAAEVSGRRPLASRHWPFSQRAAAGLAARGASPNGISVAGMVFGLAAGAAFWATARVSGPAWPWWLAGALLVQLRLLCNLLDGMVAVEGGRRSAVGELFNEVPDSVSDAATLVGLGYAVGSVPVLGWAAALVALLVALAAVHLVMPTCEYFRHGALQFDQIFFTHLLRILALFPG